MPDLRRVHRFRDHAVAGVNWRPTRFVDEVPNLRVCGLCRMIPRRILVLPCGHLLCQSCHTASSQGCRGQCPLDQEPFEEDECDSYDFPTRKANALKVYCWNEAHGCQIQETMEDMLRHYEKECTFHTVECLRCGEEVLHRELSTHYVAGCTAAVSLAVMENTSSESRSLAFVDGTADLEELKTLMRNANHEQLLLQIQCQMNDLIEQIRNQEPRPAVITHAVSASASGAEDPSGVLRARTLPTGRQPLGKPAEDIANQAGDRDVNGATESQIRTVISSRPINESESKLRSTNVKSHFYDAVQP
ncbi:uncharacterized protein LOC119406287 [Rhipicephalus sanguineus]|uniref:uncharacterized protein LOC119406287 n=1 Tax=Rhipicephalus sanguineus TaxID=34632 RepID=UPI001895F2B0|nr:uncharacterized protein LOC119406287 [Rhipicephalus sanguineus]